MAGLYNARTTRPQLRGTQSAGLDQDQDRNEDFQRLYGAFISIRIIGLSCLPIRRTEVEDVLSVRGLCSLPLKLTWNISIKTPSLIKRIL